MDDSGHGTHVAGIIGGVGNNSLGITGVCWGVKLLPLRIIKKFGSATYGTYSAAIGALDYIRQLNSPVRRVAVANHSWGGSGYSLAMLNAINNPLSTNDPLPTGITSSFLRDTNVITLAGLTAQVGRIKIGMTISGTGIPVNTLVTIVSGSTVTLSNYTTAARTNQPLVFSNPVRPRPYGVVHVAAAGNSRANNDRMPIYPANAASGFIISVGATDSADSPSIWTGLAGTNSGRLTVDVFAPGTGIWSTRLKLPTDPSYGYESRNGTSMAAPQVAGAVALLRLWQPALTEVQARQVVIDQVDMTNELKTRCLSGGRLNVGKILDKVYSPSLFGSGGSTSGLGSAAAALQIAQAVTGRLAAGNTHNLLLDQGEVWAWGAGTSGQLGNGGSVDSSTPVKVSGLRDVVMVAVASSSSYALKADGTVWSWGSNSNFMLGLGRVVSSVERSTPQQITGLSDISWISGGSNHCLAVRSDGQLFAWGQNTDGQLGDGTTIIRSSPIMVPGLTQIIQADAGWFHSVAVDKNGAVYAWGRRASSSSNNLGDGNLAEDALTPVAITGISDVIMVEAAQTGTIYLKQDGSVWGAGAIIAPNCNTPRMLPGLTDIQFIAAGSLHALAIDREGKLFGWGNGGAGELGSGQPTGGNNNPQEVAMAGDAGIVACSAGASLSMILDGSGRVLTCGQNPQGRLGYTVLPERAFPVRHPTLDGATSLGASGPVRWASHPSKGFLVWGSVHGAGNGSTTLGLFQKPTSYQAPGLTSPILQCASGFPYITAALLANGTVVSLNSGTNPTPVSGISNVTRIAAGDNFVLAILEDQTVKSWGKNDYGQLGDGTTTQRFSPVAVPGLTGVTQVSGGRGHSLALRSDGTVWAWGNNSYGQVGDGTTNDRLAPIQVPGLTDVVKVEAVGPFGLNAQLNNGASFALTSSGALYGWGKAGSYFGQQPNPSDKLSPEVIFSSPTNPVTDFVVKPDCLVALRRDGTLISWGSTYYLGRAPGDKTSSLVPAPVYGGTNVISLVSSNVPGSILFTKQDGSVWTWGGDLFYTMGLGESFACQFVPIAGFGGISGIVSSLGAGDTANSWQFQNFSVAEILDDSLVSDSADPDADGIPNLLEYALGLNPRALTSSGLPTARTDLIGASAQSESAGSEVQLFSTPTVDLTSGKRYLAYTVNRSSGIRQDIDYIVEVSNDLINWNSGDPYTVTVLDTAETLEVYSATSLDDVPRQFMRLKIQRK
jgi:alpha-tubulin suppressor-like RCC1 family protein